MLPSAVAKQNRILNQNFGSWPQTPPPDPQGRTRDCHTKVRPGFVSISTFSLHIEVPRPSRITPLGLVGISKQKKREK